MTENQEVETKTEAEPTTKKRRPAKTNKTEEPYPPHAEIASALQEPFAKELHEKHYTGATYVSWPWYQQRFDDVVGPTNWSSEFVEERDDEGKLRRVEYTVWIRYPGAGEEVARTGFWELDSKEKWDIAHSKAFRRACVGHGIGRYLYDSSDIKSDDEMPQGYEGKQQGGRRRASGQRTGRKQGGQQSRQQQQPPSQQQAPPPENTKPINKEQIEMIEGFGNAFYSDLWESKRIELIGKASGTTEDGKASGTTEDGKARTINIDELTHKQAETLGQRLQDGINEFGNYSAYLDQTETKRQEEESKEDETLWQ